MNNKILFYIIISLLVTFTIIFYISTNKNELSSFQLAEDYENSNSDEADEADEHLPDWKNPILQEDWQEYKSNFTKNYKNNEEEHTAFQNWLKNRRSIQSSSDETWEKGDTSVSDLSKKDFQDKLLTSFVPDWINFKPSVSSTSFPKAAPATVNWVTSGKVTPVKNQGNCGSCWAFAVIGSLESLNLIKTGQSLIFSEQELVDCAYDGYAVLGCNGGWPYSALTWVQKNGITSQSSYPYKTKMIGKSQCSALKPLFSTTSVGTVSKGDVDQLARAVATQPVTVCIDAGNWGSYRSGVLNKCGNTCNHAVLLVGYTSEYWLIKNSWGTGWGEQGYIKLARGNTCGIADNVAYPLKGTAQVKSGIEELEGFDHDKKCQSWADLCDKNSHVKSNN